MCRGILISIITCSLCYISYAQQGVINCTQYIITHQYQYEDGSTTMDWPYHSWIDCGQVTDPDTLLSKKKSITKKYEKKVITVKKLDLLDCTNQEALQQFFLAIEVARVEQRANDRSFAFLILPRFFHNLYHLEDRILIGSHPNDQNLKVIFHIFDLKRVLKINQVVHYKQFGLYEDHVAEAFYDQDGKELFRCYLTGTVDRIHEFLPSYLP